MTTEQISASSLWKATAGAVVVGLVLLVTMAEGDQVDYEWATNGAAVYVDMHGEPKGDTTGYFKSYTITTVAEMKGSFIAPFEGSHGWYFRNDTDQVIQIRLSFKGQYQNPHML